MTNSYSRLLKIAAVAIVVIGVAVLYRLGILERFAEPARLAQSLVDLGAWGYVAFIVAYAFLQPFGVPGTVFVFAAPLIWPWPIAFALSMTGTMAASVIGFSFARFVGRDWISPRIPARFQRYNDALEQRAFVTVFLLRFVFWMPQLLHAFFGVSKVRASTHFWGSLVGYAIPLFLVSFFGQPLVSAMRNLPPRIWITGGIVVFFIAAAVWLWRRQRALEEDTQIVRRERREPNKARDE